MECKYCNQKFNSHQKLGGHIIWCNKNENNKIVERLLKRKETFKNIDKSNYTGKASSKELELERRRKISSTMKLNPKAGGLREGSGRGKKCWYESKIAGNVYVRSTYELEYVKWLDANNINWIGNKTKFEYQYEGKIRYYYPDFYLIDEKCYVEIKGFETKQDKEKWKCFPYTLRVLKYKDLKQLGLDIKN